MVERKRNRDGKSFWGCSRFPECRGTRPGAEESQSLSKNSNRPEWTRREKTNPKLPKCIDKLPSALSPTKAIEFMQCPRKYYESAISKRIVFQGSEATVKGNLVHYSLEKIFDLPPNERNLLIGQKFIDNHWPILRKLPENKAVSKLNDSQTYKMLEGAKNILAKWFQFEDPKTINPRARELEIKATIGNTPMAGVIDRIDNKAVNVDGSPLRLLSEKGAIERVKIIDYKTGKIPKSEYLDESLFQIYSYALALESSYNCTVDEVQLLYVAHSHSIERKFTDNIRKQTSSQINKIWKEIRHGCETGRFPAIPQPLCDWCDAKSICPSWTS